MPNKNRGRFILSLLLYLLLADRCVSALTAGNRALVGSRARYPATRGSLDIAAIGVIVVCKSKGSTDAQGDGCADHQHFIFHNYMKLNDLKMEMNSLLGAIPGIK